MQINATQTANLRSFTALGFEKENVLTENKIDT